MDTSCEHIKVMILAVPAKSYYLPISNPTYGKAQLRLAPERGMASYLSDFVGATGRCYTHPGRGRQGGVEGYTEGLQLMLAVLKLLSEDRSLFKRTFGLIPNVLHTAVDVCYDALNGKVGTYRRFKKTYSIGSIGFGPGPMMEPIASVLVWLMTAGLESAKTYEQSDRRS